MSKIYIEEALYDLKRILEQTQFIIEKISFRPDPNDHFGDGLLTGIELCIKELEKRLEGM